MKYFIRKDEWLKYKYKYKIYSLQISFTITRNFDV